MAPTESDSAGAGSCVFCQIVEGSLPAEVVRSTDRTVAFRDLNPQAPTHVLVVPRSHHPNAQELARHDPASLAEVFGSAAAVAVADGLEAYRTVFNTGVDAGQTVFHAHLHVLGGRSLGWPPG